MDVEKFLIQFQDHLAPKLDTYEQAVYLYIFRHTRLIGRDETVIGFASARKKMAFGIGEKGKPMSQHSCYARVRSLASKGCIEVRATEQLGMRVALKLPDEIPNVIPSDITEQPVSLEEIDFFGVAENRSLILGREGNKCFYCLRDINGQNYVIEHVVSRPEGNNSYRNVVAACRQCNNKKGPSLAEDFLRTLYREGFVDASEFEGRLSHLQRLKDGDLKPALPTL